MRNVPFNNKVKRSGQPFRFSFERKQLNEPPLFLKTPFRTRKRQHMLQYNLHYLQLLATQVRDSTIVQLHVEQQLETEQYKPLFQCKAFDFVTFRWSCHEQLCMVYEKQVSLKQNIVINLSCFQTTDGFNESALKTCQQRLAPHTLWSNVDLTQDDIVKNQLFLRQLRLGRI